MTHLMTYLFIILSCIFFLHTIPKARAAVTSLTTGIALRQEYDSNVFRTPDNEIDEWNTYVSPLVALSSEWRANQTSLRYEPDFIYNNRTSDDTFNHNVFFNSDFELQHTTISLSDTFLQRENPYSDEDVGIDIIDERGRNRYTANNAAVDLKHDFGRRDYYGLGYSYYTFDNEENFLEDFTRQKPYVELGIELSPHWQSILRNTLTYGDFEISDNVVSNQSEISFNRYISPSRTLLLHYIFNYTDYQGDSPDYDVHTAGIGYTATQPETDFHMEVGASHVQGELDEDETTGYLLLNIEQQDRHGTYILTGESGFEGLYFSGDVDGLSRYWLARADIRYQFAKTIRSSIYTSYREDTFVEREPELQEQLLRAGTSVSFGFFRWYALVLDYAYTRLYADRAADEYDDHRFFIELRAQKEVWKY